MLGRDAMRQFQEWKEEAPGTNTINNSMILIGMSANASKRDQEEAYDYGMHYFAAKPVDLVFLTAVLEAKRSGGRLDRVMQAIQANAGAVSPPARRCRRWRSSRSLHSLNSNRSSGKYDRQPDARERLVFVNSYSSKNRIRSVSENHVTAAAVTENLPTKPKMSQRGGTVNMLTRFGESLAATFASLSGILTPHRVSPLLVSMTEATYSHIRTRNH